MTAQLALVDPPKSEASAIFSTDRRFRFLLSRSWAPDLAVVHFVMLNPSIADEHVLDPTLRRCMAFAGRWGFGGMLITNLWPLVSTDPKALKTTPDACGPKGGGPGGIFPLNDEYIWSAAKMAEFTVVGWGTNAGKTTRDGYVPHVYHSLLKPYGPVYCLRTTKVGHPVHPLYIPYDCTLKEWSP